MNSSVVAGRVGAAACPHYGAIAKDALALFPASPLKEALEEAVELCICRSN